MKALQRKKGFTLVELIIVIVILGILGTIAIPQFINSTKDAQEATITSNLAVMRNAINLYYHQHQSTYPGKKNTDGSGADLAAAQAPAAFGTQLNQYTDKLGKVSATLDRTNYPFGPYLTTLVPASPLNNSTSVKIIDTNAAIAGSDASGADGWIFNRNTGELRINDAAHIAL